MAKGSLKHYRRLQEEFLAIRAISDLAGLLNTEARQLSLLGKPSAYRTFTIPKSKGGQRSIEAPQP